jgi:hypothetical protein
MIFKKFIKKLFSKKNKPRMQLRKNCGEKCNENKKTSNISDVMDIGIDSILVKS